MTTAGLVLQWASWPLMAVGCGACWRDKPWGVRVWIVGVVLAGVGVTLTLPAL